MKTVCPKYQWAVEHGDGSLHGEPSAICLWPSKRKATTDASATIGGRVVRVCAVLIDKPRVKR